MRDDDATRLRQIFKPVDPLHPRLVAIYQILLRLRTAAEAAIGPPDANTRAVVTVDGCVYETKKLILIAFRNDLNPMFLG